MATKKPIEYYSGLIEEWKNSGLNQKEFILLKGITKSMFYHAMEVVKRENNKGFVKLENDSSSNKTTTINIDYYGAVIHAPSSSLEEVFRAIKRC